MSEQDRTLYTPLSGGLDLISTDDAMNPGRCRLAINYETDDNGNYKSLEGYSLFGGGAVPGTGPILGLAVFQSEVFALRETSGAAKLYRSTGSGWTEIVPASGSLAVARYSIVAGTFGATATAERLYFQAYGANKPLEWDGTNINVFADANTPTAAHYLSVHSNYLVIANRLGSVALSTVGIPTDWTTAPIEIGTSDIITGVATSPGGVLSVFGDSSIQNLYGTTSTDFALKPHSKAGVKPYSMQNFGNSAKFLSDNGLTSLEAVQSYGDFSLGQWGQMVDPLFDASPVVKDSAALKEKNQYWLFTGNKSAVICRFYGADTVGITTATFPDQMELAASGLFGSDETLFMGDDAGKVYQMNSGTSFNGAAINTTLTPGYNHLKMPNVRKRIRRVIADIKGQTATSVSILPQFDYGGQDHARHILLARDILTSGGQWGLSNWDEFAWTRPSQDKFKVDISGTGINFDLVINTTSTTDSPHTWIGYMTSFAPRRMIRD